MSKRRGPRRKLWDAIYSWRQEMMRLGMAQKPNHWAATGRVKHPLHRFRRVDEMQVFTDKVLASNWTKKRYGVRSITIDPGKGCKSMIPWPWYPYEGPLWSLSVIKAPLRQRYTYMLLYGITWILLQESGKLRGVRENEDEQRIVAAHYLGMVKHFCGKEYHDLLKNRMKVEGAKYSKPRADKGTHRPVPEGTVERMMAGRAIKSLAE